MAGVDEVYNGVSVTGDVVGTTVLIGRGAGQDATSSSVISDIADAVFMLQGATAPAISKEDEAVYAQLAEGLELSKPEDMTGCYYVRISVRDQEGVLAKVTDIMAKEHISISSVNQKEFADGTATIMVTTHRICEGALKRAKLALTESDAVVGKPVSFRIFDPNKA